MTLGPALALIPARAGSKRVPDKNVRPLAGHPAIAYSIAAALESGCFAAVVVSTDSEAYARIARHYGAEVPFLRPTAFAGDTSPDVEWVRHALLALREAGREFACFSILRPTSPFRSAGTIRRAFESFAQEAGVDSLRAVEVCKQHPGKMWVVRGRRMHPLLPLSPEEQPWHSSQFQALPTVYIQNASLELAHTRVALDGGTIAGTTVMPFFTEDFEGFDINHPDDFRRAEELVRDGTASLPNVAQPPFTSRGS